MMMPMTLCPQGTPAVEPPGASDQRLFIRGAGDFWASVVAEHCKAAKQEGKQQEGQPEGQERSGSDGEQPEDSASRKRERETEADDEVLTPTPTLPGWW
jgi:hypothetical protein